LLPWLIMRYLGEVSHIEDRACEGAERPELSRASQESRIESMLDCVFSWMPTMS
jgi:hypothetical protein